MPKPFKRSSKQPNKGHRGRKANNKFVAEPFAQHHEVTVTIESLSNQGDGVAKVDIPEKQLTQWVIFIPFTIPGETVRARIISNRKNCSIGEVITITHPSEHRREPKCEHFTLCGGCQYQHIGYQIQLDQKSLQIQQLLQHIAGIESRVNPTIASPQEYYYRSKITPHFRKPYNGKISSIGFVSKQQGREYLDIQYCPIAMQEINDELPKIREQVHHGAKQYKQDTTLLLRAAEGKVATNPSTVITENVNGIDFHFLAGDFFQNNPFILNEFVKYAAKESSGNEYLIDAYCGSGLFSLSLASSFKAVKGVEISETAADWAKQNARLNGIDNTDFIAASADAIFKEIDFEPQSTTVLIDPPRAGCSTDFLNQLFSFNPSKVVYISCDPATQMRDLRHFLEHGYTVENVQPFDLFPQTKHLECIITLKVRK